MNLELPEMPARIKALPRDKRGYPVPWFVQWIDGEPQFPIMDPGKRALAVLEKRCWVCGERLGQYMAFVVGPMCGINRTSSEPPAHLECANFSVRACPFLKNPNMKRIENEHTKDGQSPGGIMVRRNPGVSLIWVTKTFKIFADGNGGWLIRLGNPNRIAFYKEGRLACQDEIFASIEAGCPAIEAMISTDEEREEFTAAKAWFSSMVEQLVPGG